MPSALIIGIAGQDGSYLAELLLGKGYEVHGVLRRSSNPNLTRLEAVKDKIQFHWGDLAETRSICRIVGECQPDEVYNLGAMSDVRISFDVPEYSGDVTGIGALRVMEVLRGSKARLYQAASSEMFGSSPPPQNEQTPFHPRSPYGCAKVFAYWSAVNHREAYGMHVSNGILFNHESSRRGENFVTRKIAKAVARIMRGEQHLLWLGNLSAKRDWGFAGDYVDAMWRMLQQEKPDDYVIATGEAHSVQEFVEEAFGLVGLDWQKHVQTDHNLFRPSEVEHLLGDPEKAKRQLGWEPKVNFQGLVRMMVEAEL